MASEIDYTVVARRDAPLREKSAQLVKNSSRRVIRYITGANSKRREISLCAGRPLRRSEVEEKTSACSVRNDGLPGPGQELRRLFCLGRSGGFGAGYQACKCGGILDREIGEDFAVERDAGGFEAVDQLAVGEAVVAGRSADALNPELAVLALFDAAIALGVPVGAIGGFLRGLVELALG